MVKVSKKFIIIDHSLSNLQGHYYECSISVAEAVQKQGYTAIIVTNKSFSSDLYPENIKIIPEFEVDWLNNYNRQLSSLQNQINNFTETLINFNWQNIIQNYQQKITYQIFKLKLTKPNAKLFLEKLEGSTSRLIGWIKKDISLIQYIPLTNTFWGLLKIIWGLIRFPFNILLKSLLTIWLKLFAIKPKTFQQSLVDILQQIQPNSEDHIFIHTLSIEQLEDLLNILVNSEQNHLPQYHIMLRRDIDDPLVKNAQGMGIRACLNQFYRSQLFPNKVRFYTDTLPLIERYNSLSPVQFLEIPVPFRQEKLLKFLELPLDKEENNLIHLVYLGDARTEKGYLYLPQIIEQLWAEYFATNKVKITIQSNFNIDNGEIGILATRLKLEQYPEKQVKIIKKAMKAEEYYQLLASADVVIIPYNTNSYYYRTSGVLIESLAVGKPVIVPANSWLATQVDETRAGIYQQPEDISKIIIKVISNLQQYQNNAQAFSWNWRQKHSPNYLISCLLSEHNFKFNSTESSLDSSSIMTNNQTLFLINVNNLLKLDIEGQIIFSHLQYLANSGWEITIIFYTLDSSYADEFSNDLNTKIETLIKQIKIEKYYWLLLQFNEFPQFINDLNQDQYVQDIYQNKASLTTDLVNLNSLLIPDSLITYLQSQTLKLIFIDSIISQPVLNNLPVNNIPIICQVCSFKSYEYAIKYHQEINQQEWQIEKDLFNRINLALTINQSQSDKLKEINPNLITATLPNYYPLQSFDHSISKNVNIIEFIWGNKYLIYQQIISDNISKLLMQKLDENNQLNQPQKKIAILYPWGDILSRKTGSSKRVGLLLDFLENEGNYIWFFTSGAEKELLINQTRYTFYEQKFTDLDLVKKVYTNSYSALIETNQLSEKQCNDLSDQSLNNHQQIQEIVEDWRLSMYYQFICDRTFEEWIEKIVDWADIVFLEYPFWAKTVSKICQEKNVNLIITNHDIIYQQITENSYIKNILLAEEISSLKLANQVITVSPEDQQLLTNYNIDSIVIANPVNLQFLEQNISSDNEKNYLENYPWLTDNYCLFVGSSHFPNLEAVKNIKKTAKNYQQLDNKIDCKFIVVGGCCESENYDNFMSLGEVELEFLQVIYQYSNLILAPMLSGTGSSLKIIEAMSYSKVIIGTKIAFRGYPIESEKQAIICDNLTEYPIIINQLLSDKNQLEIIGKQAQDLAKNYDYRQLYRLYLKIIS